MSDDDGEQVGVGDTAGVAAPTAEQAAHYASLQFATADELDAEHIAVLYERWIRQLDRLDELENPPVVLRYPDREPGRAPRDTEEDPYHAIVRFCEVKGADDGPLAGMRLAVKDTIPVAGVPMVGNNRQLPTRVPAEDAVVVERLLDAGATIVAKTNVSFPGTQSTSLDDTHNPLDRRFSPGGSSSGTGAAVAAGMVDAGLGTDAAGSVRIPAAWCGLVGMKATHGLIPLHGCRDHLTNSIGPLTTTVADNAAMLEVMAGPDWRDPHAASPGSGAAITSYTGAAGLDIDGLRVGVVAESLQPSGCTPGTLRAFDRARDVLAGLGAELRPVSVPLWTDTAAFFWPIYFFGTVAEADSFGRGYANLARMDLSMMDAVLAQHQGVGARALRLMVEHLRQSQHGGMHFAKAQNLAVELRRQVDALFDDVDLLITPTTAVGPLEVWQKAADGSETVKQQTPMQYSQMLNLVTANPWVFNLTGHPALTVPAGLGDDELPFGLQIVGRRSDEFNVYRAGFALEAAA